MDLTMEPSMLSLQLAVARAQDDIKELRVDMAQAHKFITGNGDPTKGLLWLAANAQSMNAALAVLIDAESKALRTHLLEEHKPLAAPSITSRLGYEALRQVIVASIMIVLAIFALGVLTFVRTGKLL